jgi:hypothetical protein
MRSAFMQRRMTDLGVYLRAAWAVRVGENIYDITDDNKWHYQYPPLFAILMVPLADPPGGADRSWALPYPVSVAIWYVVGIACLVFAVHSLASAIERGSVPRGRRRWWALRVIPLVACLVPVAHTLMRGQVNLLLLALICGAAASVVRGQSARAGLWLSGAICLKVIPAFLLLVPLWRRDTRCLAAVAVGLFIGLLLIPATVFGVPRTLDYYRQYDQKLLRPGLGAGEDQSRVKELLGSTANDSQSIMAAINNAMHTNRYTRPVQANAIARWSHGIAGISLTFLTLAAAGWKPSRDPVSLVLFVGLLVLVMLLISPISHLHYFCLVIPLMTGLVALTLDRGSSAIRWGLAILLCFNIVVLAVPNIPGLEVFRDRGIAMYGGLVLWVVGGVCLWKRRQPREEVHADDLPLAA